MARQSLKGIIRNTPLKAKLYVLFAAFLVMGLVVFLVFTRITSDLALDARMVNVAGSARMQMYRLLYIFKDVTADKKIELTDKSLIVDKMNSYVLTLREVDRYLAAREQKTEALAGAAVKIDVLSDSWKSFETLLITYLLSPEEYGVLIPDINIRGVEMVEVTDRLVADIERHHKSNISRVWTIIVSLFAGSVIFTLLVGYLLIRYMIFPLSRLERFAGQIAKGDLSARLDYDGKDEIGTLVDAMNGMATELEDIRKTMEKRIEDQSEQLASVKKLAAVGHIAAGVAHEINNPLATMQICVDSLHRKYSDAENRGEHVLLQGYLRIIDDELKRCAAITTGLLDFSRERPPKKEPVDVKTLIEDTGSMLLIQRKYSNSCKVDYDFKAENNVVLGDDGQLRQVFLNIMGNGFDAMGGKGVVKVSTSSVSRLGRNMLCVKLEDSGHGIKSDDMGKVFMPFFTTKTAERGTGLGLSICKKIITGHEGLIEVDSVYGAGTTFTVCLAQYEKKDEAAPEHEHIQKGFFINLM